MTDVFMEVILVWFPIALFFSIPLGSIYTQWRELTTWDL